MSKFAFKSQAHSAIKAADSKMILRDLVYRCVRELNDDSTDSDNFGWSNSPQTIWMMKVSHDWIWSKFVHLQWNVANGFHGWVISEKERETWNLPFAYSPFQHKWRAILWAAKDFPRHGRPTRITTNGARSGHGAMLFCINVVVPIFWPGIIQSKQKKWYLSVNAVDSMEIFLFISSSWFDRVEFRYRIWFAWAWTHDRFVLIAAAMTNSIASTNSENTNRVLLHCFAPFYNWDSSL